MTELFKPVNSTEQKAIDSYYETLVGEGKKFKDQEELAKGKYESDAFIKKITEENEQMRKELSTRMTLEEFWEKTTQNKKTNEDRTDIQSREPAAQVNAPKPEEIMDLVRKTLHEETSKSQKTQNVEMVREELTRVWGPDFSDKLNIRARELGSTPEFLGSMAETQPKAFLALMLGRTERSDNINDYVPPRTAYNAPATAPKRGRTFADYEKMRKENKDLYWSRQTQMQMFKDAKELGEAFYKS